MENQEIFEQDKNREVFHKFMDVQHIMGALRHCKRAQGGPGCDPMRGRGRILALLKLKDGVATKDMAQILGIRVSSLNETLAKLEKDGLVERTPSEEDKRIMLVNLTEAGRAQAQPAGRFPARMFADFTEEDLEAFEGYLDRITANLEADLGEDSQEFLENMRKARREFMGGGRGCCHGHGPGHGPGEGHGHGPGECHGHGPGMGHGHERHHGECHHHGHGPGMGHGHCHHHGGFPERDGFPGEGHGHCHHHHHGGFPEHGPKMGRGCCHRHGHGPGMGFGHCHHHDHGHGPGMGHGCCHRHDGFPGHRHPRW